MTLVRSEKVFTGTNAFRLTMPTSALEVTNQFQETDGTRDLYEWRGTWVQLDTGGDQHTFTKDSDLQVDDPVFNEQMMSDSAAGTTTVNGGISHKKNWTFNVTLISGDTIEFRGYLGTATPIKLHLIDQSTGAAITHPITAIAALVTVDPPGAHFDSIDIVKVGTAGIATVRGIGE